MPFWSGNLARTPILLLAVAEATVLFLSVFITKGLFADAEGGRFELTGPLATQACSVAAVMLISLYAMGLYQFRQRIYYHEVLARILAAAALVAIVLIAAHLVVPRPYIEPKVVISAIASAFILLTVIRYIFVHSVDESIFRRRTVIYGAGRRSEAIADLRRRADRRGFRLLGYVAAPGDEIREDATRVIHDVKCLQQFALDNRADEVVVAMDDRRGNLPIRALLDLKLRGIDVIDIVDFLERETGKIHLDLVNPGWLIFGKGFRASSMKRYVKRAFDILIASVMLTFTWPVMIGVSVLIKLFDGPSLPVLYRQERVGLYGKRFDVLKFRSMRPDAEADGTAQWATTNDPRVTRIGNFLRLYRLDELPQIFNVLAGHMSIVGPRPERPEFVEQLAHEIPFYDERHTVKPGLTGWAQLKYKYGASTNDAFEKLQYDLYYVKNQSVLLDLMIVLQTVEVVLWNKGAR